MSVNSYLSDFASELVLSESEKNSITTSITTLKTRLASYFGSSVEDKIVFGSYIRGTILPRKKDENSDIDTMVVFSNPDLYKPQTFLNKLKDFAHYYYSHSEIYQDSPTVVLELNHIKFELIPAYHYYGSVYKIPNGPSEWQQTDPTEHSDMLLESNKNNGYKVKPIVRLVKLWNIQRNNRDYASFELEKKIALGLHYAYFTCTSYTDYLDYAFKEIRNTDNATRIDTARRHIAKALSYENDNMPYSASEEIKKIFD